MVPKFVDECLSKDAQKRLTVFEAQHGHLAPGTAGSFLKLWSAIGKSETIHALDLDRKVQTNFSARFLNETGCSYFKVACNSTSIASLLVPGDPSSADLVDKEWEVFSELDLPQRLIVLGLLVNCGVTIFCFGEKPGIIDAFWSAFPKMDVQREVLLGVNTKQELFSIVPSSFVQVSDTLSKVIGPNFSPGGYFFDLQKRWRQGAIERK